MVDARCRLEVGCMRRSRDTNKDAAFAQGRGYEIFGMDFDKGRGANTVMALCGNGVAGFWARKHGIYGWPGHFQQEIRLVWVPWPLFAFSCVVCVCVCVVCWMVFVAMEMN